MSTVLLASATMLATAIDATAGNLTWAVQPTPTGSGNTSLNAVSCPSSSACTAVGTTAIFGGGDVLAEHWNGRTWVIQSTPNAGSLANDLVGVSCPSTSFCTAVGYYAYDEQNPPRTLTEHWNGSSWVVQPTPTPGGGTLGDVACLSTSFCSAVGVYYATSALALTLVQHWNGSSWSIQSTPNPVGADISALSGISCLSTSFCTAVGVYYPSSSGVPRTLAEHWNGSSWKIQSTPNPSSLNSALTAVSCNSTTACAAVGTYHNASGGSLAFAERWDGHGWHIQSIPNPSGTKSSRLAAVSCPSSTSCVAVGSYNRSGALTLAEQWNGSTWSVQSTPNPVPSTDRLLGVSCSSDTLCTAVGEYDTTHTVTLAERYS